MFLVLDIEGTCVQGSNFDYPNEIIEFPVVLLGWTDKAQDMTASELVVIDEFRSFVRPTWRPELSEFCKDLTGIQQHQVDAAPSFPEVLLQLEQFMRRNGLIDENGERLLRFCWCTDGPCDVRDFVIKQCFISKIPIPWYFKGDVIDVRTMVLRHLSRGRSKATLDGPNPLMCQNSNSGLTRRSLNIAAQLKVLELPEFEGRQHSGIDDTRNISRVIIELGRRGVNLLPNTSVQPNRRWAWMGKKGKVLEEYIK